MKKVKVLFILIFISITALGQKLIFPEVSPGEEITIKGKRVNLSGSLLLPEQRGTEKIPAIIYISGSGDVSYRSHFHPESDYTYCKDLAEMLLARGMAVFFLEKRGINQTGGNWRKAGFQDYADDVAQVIQYLKGRPEIDADQIGLMGHSQGGYIAQVVASQHQEDISLLINLVGPAQDVYHQVLFDMHNQYTCRGYRGGSLKLRMACLKASLVVVKASSYLVKPVFLSHVIRHNPSDYLPNINCPILTVYAENDYMVDELLNTQLMTQMLWNKSEFHWIHTIEGVNHHFLKSDLCYSWNDIDKTVHPEIFTIINNWLDTLNYLAANR